MSKKDEKARKIPVAPPLPCPMVTLAPSCQRRCTLNEIAGEESQRLCQRLFDNDTFWMEDQRRHLVSCNYKVTPILQEGPSCGLAALCMAAQLLTNTLAPPTLSQVLEVARRRGYTNKGEMFSGSTINMALLAKEVLAVEVELLMDCFNQKTKILTHIASGQPILVPYDADMNHEPTCRQGHKAHWAVLTGVVFSVPHTFQLPTTALQQDRTFPALFHTKGFEVGDHSLNGLITAGDHHQAYVYAYQGKSCHVSLWSYEMLAKSNANLTELCPSQRRSNDGYVLPVDGVEGGLCRKVLLMRRNSSFKQ